MYNYKNKNRFWIIPIRFTAFVGVVSLILMLLWNAIIPTLIVGVGTLTYIKAVGLLVISKILFSGFPNKGAHKNGFMQNSKMMNMTDEEREKFKTEWKNRCGK